MSLVPPDLRALKGHLGSPGLQAQLAPWDLREQPARRDHQESPAQLDRLGQLDQLVPPGLKVLQVSLVPPVPRVQLVQQVRKDLRAHPEPPEPRVLPAQLEAQAPQDPRDHQELLGLLVQWVPKANRAHLG